MKKILKNESKNVILWVDIQTSTLSSNASLWDVGMLTVLFSFLSPIFIFSMDILVDSPYKNLLWNIPLEYWHKNLIFWTKISDGALSTLLTLKKLWRPFLEVLWVEIQVASRWFTSCSSRQEETNAKQEWDKIDKEGNEALILMNLKA